MRADHELQSAIELDPNLAEAYHLRAKLLGMLSRHQEAIAMQKKAMELDPFSRPGGWPTSICRHDGYTAVLHWRIHDLENDSTRHYVSPVALAEPYAQLGNRQKTLALLEEAYRQHSPQLLWIQNDGSFDFLHTDERYRALVREIGLPRRSERAFGVHRRLA